MSTPSTPPLSTTPVFAGYIATSLDGFIARPHPNCELDWLERAEWSDPDGGDYGFKDFLASIDCIVMGRNTFDKVCGHNEWIYGDVPVYVVSSTLQQLPNKFSQHNLHLINKSSSSSSSSSNITTADIIAHMQQFRRVYIDGGTLLQHFTRAGKLDEIIITRIPVLIGDGIPLFGPISSDDGDGSSNGYGGGGGGGGGKDIKLQHISTQAYASGLTQSHYKFIRNSPSSSSSSLSKSSM